MKNFEFPETKNDLSDIEKLDAEYKIKDLADIKHLTEIEDKIKEEDTLTKDDLVFLYEINSSLEDPSYKKYPRVKEIRKNRNKKEDASVIFDCQPNQVANKEEKINENTKVYIGPLFPGIFSKNIEHIYASFPEGKIEKAEMTIGDKSKEELIKELAGRAESKNPDEKINVDDWAKSMLKNSEFIVAKKPEQINLVRLRVEALGVPRGVNLEEFYKKAEELGLELCPSEVGLRSMLNYEQVFKRKQPIPEHLNIGMKQITDYDNEHRVFKADRGIDGQRQLQGEFAAPDYGRSPREEFIFRYRK